MGHLEVDCFIFKYLRNFQTSFVCWCVIWFHYFYRTYFVLLDTFEFIETFLWPRTWSILLNTPCALEKKCVFWCYWMEYSKNVNWVNEGECWSLLLYPCWFYAYFFYQLLRESHWNIWILWLELWICLFLLAVYLVLIHIFWSSYIRCTCI